MLLELVRPCHNWLLVLTRAEVALNKYFTLFFQVTNYYLIITTNP